MKAARLVVLTVAVAAGGVAALLAGRSEKPPEPKPNQHVNIRTTDVRIAKADVGMGQVLSPQHLQWRSPAPSAATRSERPYPLMTDLNSTDDEPGADTPRRRINIIRFGVSTVATPK